MDYRQAVQAGYDGFAKGDPGPLLGLMGPKVEWTEAEGFPYAGTYVGADAIVNGVFVKLATEWDGYLVTPDSIVVDGDRAISIGTYSGTYKATGRSFVPGSLTSSTSQATSSFGSSRSSTVSRCRRRSPPSSGRPRWAAVRGAVDRNLPCSHGQQEAAH